MNANIKLKKELLSPPGDTIQETIDYMGMSQAELVERLGRPKEKVNDIIKGREPISTETAFRLEKVLGIPASFWINREHLYRQKLYEIEQEEKLALQYDWLKNFPLAEMKKRGQLSNTRNKTTLTQELLIFFGVASHRAWEKIYVQEEISVAFRISLARTQNPYAISVWLRLGELDAQKIKTETYSKSNFKKALKKVKELVFKFPDDFASQLQIICAEAGVVVTYVPSLPGAPISGATRWFHGKPLIQLSDRYKTDDHFWFTFFHEAGHILLHGKKDIFLVKVKGTAMDQKKELEANAFAAKQLLTNAQFQKIIQSPLSDDDIVAFAKKFRISPGVIVGRLQHEGVLDWSARNNLKKQVVLF